MKAEVIKYVIAGGLAFACDISVLYLCTEMLGFHYLVSNVFGYCAGLTVAYLLNVYWVFSYRKYKKAGTEFLIFNAIVICGLGISELIMSLLVDGSGMNYLHAKIVASFFVTLFNFAAKKYFLFHPSPQSTQDQNASSMP